MISTELLVGLIIFGLYGWAVYSNFTQPIPPRPKARDGADPDGWFN